MEYGLVLLWLATYLALAVLGLPVAAALFPRFADRGAGVALALSTAVLAVVGYWVGQVAFGLPAVLAGLMVLGAAAALALRRGADPDWEGFADAAVVFVVAFGLLLSLRAFDPAAWPGGGEKFLDFGLLASLLRGSTLPPQDVWFAGEPVRYYYGGHMLAAMLAEMTGTPARYAYNLALAGFYATLVTTAYGLAGAVGADRGYSRRAAGATAAFLVGLASNLSTPLRLGYWLLPGGWQSTVAGWLGEAPEGLADGPANFDYWHASRVIEGTINEFPFFAWFNGDLHAHMMSTPFLLLAAALLFAYWQTPAYAVWRRRALLFAGIPPVMGVVAVTSTWSVPTVAGLTALTLTFAPAAPASLLPRPLARRLDADPASGTPRNPDSDVGPDDADAGDDAATDRLFDEVGRTSMAVGVAAVVTGLGVLAALPFFLGPASGREVGLLPDRSGLGELLVVHGAFLAISAAYLLSRSRLGRDGRLAAGTVALALLAAAWWLDLAVVALFVPLVVAGWWLLRTGRPVGYETVLVVGVAGVVTLVEFAFVQEQAGPGRMNTVFKTYMQVWVLWGTAAGVMAVGLLERARAAAAVDAVVARLDRLLGGESDGDGEPAGRAAARDGGQPVDRRAAAAAVVAALLAVSLSLYAGLAVSGAATGDRGAPTLDARSYVEDYHPGEAEAIEFVAGLEGQPTLASAPGTDIYRWVNAPSSLTGVPTVAGWVHEVGYRGPGPYYDRVRDVEILFEGDRRSREAMVEKYGVDYVYVGPIENERYDDPDFRGEPGFEVVHQSGDVTIYAVDRSALG